MLRKLNLIIASSTRSGCLHVWLQLFRLLRRLETQHGSSALIQQKGLVFRRGLLIAICNISLACGGSRLLAEDGVMNFEKLRLAATDTKVLHDRTDRLEEFLKILA